MQTPTAGRKLKDWLNAGKKKGRSQEWLAKALGVRQPTVYRWLSGENRPGTCFAMALQDLTKGRVKVEDWMFEQERRVAFAFRSPGGRKLAGGGCS